MKLILALDLGTHTGVARGVCGAPPADIKFETWHMPSGGGRDVGSFAATFMSKFKAAIEGVDVCAFEQPFIGGFGKARPDVVRRFYGMAFVIEGVCALRHVPCAEVNIASLKKEFGGHGKASKEEMILAAHRRGFRVNNEHEADAAAVFHSTVGQIDRRALDKYDPDFRLMMRANK